MFSDFVVPNYNFDVPSRILAEKEKGVKNAPGIDAHTTFYNDINNTETNDEFYYKK